MRVLVVIKVHCCVVITAAVSVRVSDEVVVLGERSRGGCLIQCRGRIIIFVRVGGGICRE